MRMNGLGLFRKVGGYLAVASVAFFGIGCGDASSSTSESIEKLTAAEVARRNAVFDESTALSLVTMSTSRHPVSRVPPVLLVDISREPRSFNDLFRFSFISDLTIVPTTLNRMNANRAFMTASYYFMPPLSVESAVQYVGLADEPGSNFAAYRCQPRDEGEQNALDPVLATWPNVFDIIQQDLGSLYSCPGGVAPPDANVDNQLLCIANQFVDVASSNVSIAFDRMYDIAEQLFQDPALVKEINRLYGIAPAFSGLGYAVKGSANDAELTTEEMIRNLIAPEYLVRNVTFGAANCRCILVPPYEGRAQDPIDPDFVWKVGSSGSCRIVDRLRTVSGKRYGRWWSSAYEDVGSRSSHD